MVDFADDYSSGARQEAGSRDSIQTSCMSYPSAFTWVFLFELMGSLAGSWVRSRVAETHLELRYGMLVMQVAAKCIVP